MAQLLFSEQADEMLTALESDATRREPVGRLHQELDQLEADPGASACRRRRYSNIGVWGIPVHSQGEEWLILWEPDERNAVVVYAITSAP